MLLMDLSVKIPCPQAVMFISERRADRCPWIFFRPFLSSRLTSSPEDEMGDDTDGG
ncbi:hypothetical protein [Geobacillus sp. C56-T2]|uniref:hypothetical protein n=1 Tax=Geobacillus sp. C56-T2 TaxID=600773 RepID=UPI0011AC76B5|nr:hypothetical protein [Geobacillus sp. C56-T2]TWG31259.1 hypothetical protein GC56T2_2470 [Geobacillus sp. C56-T2]